MLPPRRSTRSELTAQNSPATSSVNPNRFAVPYPKRQGLYDAFADGWDVESVQPVRGEVNPAFTAEFPKDGSKMWFAVIRRKD